MENIEYFMRWYIENRQRFAIIIPNLINLNPRIPIEESVLQSCPVCWEENVPSTFVCGQCPQRSACIHCAWRLQNSCPLCRFEGSSHLQPPRGRGRGILNLGPQPPRGRGRGILGQRPRANRWTQTDEHKQKNPTALLRATKILEKKPELHACIYIYIYNLF